MHADHGTLDDVGGGALEGRVDGGPFGEVAARRVLAGDLGYMAFAAEQRCDEAVLTTKTFHLLHVVADAGIILEIGLHIGLGVAQSNAQLARQPEGGNTVDNAKIDGLGAVPGLAVHVL